MPSQYKKPPKNPYREIGPVCMALFQAIPNATPKNKQAPLAKTAAELISCGAALSAQFI